MPNAIYHCFPDFILQFESIEDRDVVASTEVLSLVLFSWRKEYRNEAIQ